MPFSHAHHHHHHFQHHQPVNCNGPAVPPVSVLTFYHLLNVSRHTSSGMTALAFTWKSICNFTETLACSRAIGHVLTMLPITHLPNWAQR